MVQVAIRFAVFGHMPAAFTPRAESVVLRPRRATSPSLGCPGHRRGYRRSRPRDCRCRRSAAMVWTVLRPGSTGWEGCRHRRPPVDLLILLCGVLHGDGDDTVPQTRQHSDGVQPGHGNPTGGYLEPNFRSEREASTKRSKAVSRRASQASSVDSTAAIAKWNRMGSDLAWWSESSRRRHCGQVVGVRVTLTLSQPRG